MASQRGMIWVRTHPEMRQQIGITKWVIQQVVVRQIFPRLGQFSITALLIVINETGLGHLGIAASNLSWFEVKWT